MCVSCAFRHVKSMIQTCLKSYELGEVLTIMKMDRSKTVTVGHLSRSCWPSVHEQCKLNSFTRTGQSG